MKVIIRTIKNHLFILLPKLFNSKGQKLNDYQGIESSIYSKIQIDLYFGGNYLTNIFDLNQICERFPLLIRRLF